MALYALGDLHLSFQANKPMDAFGKVWKHHERKIEKYVNQIVGPEDTLVLTGDHSWGRKLSECREDLAFIERLPGRKILLRETMICSGMLERQSVSMKSLQERCFFCRITLQYIRIMPLSGRKDIRLKDRFIWTEGEW